MLPTRGENFGHVIFEAISNGLPSMISDKTPWKSDSKNGLVTIPLIEKDWANAILEWTKLDKSTLLKRRKDAINYASNYILLSKTITKTKKLINLAEAHIW